MASGYVVAAFLEVAGLIGLVIAVLKLRAERQAKVAELRSYLRSGQVAAPAANGVGSQRSSGGRVIALPYAPIRARTFENQASAARSALGRAILRDVRPSRTDLATGVSAG